MDFVAIDFETSTYARNSACSIGLAKFINGEVVDVYYSLIRPPLLYIRPDFTRIHGLTVSDVEDEEHFDVVWENGARAFIGDMPLVAHNAGFDMAVLKATLTHYGVIVPHYKYFDSLMISRKVWPNLESHALTALGQYFGIEYDAHNALADATVCGRVVMLAAQKLCDEGKLDYDDLVQSDVRLFLKAANVRYRRLTV